IELEYQETVAFEDGTFRLRVPTTLTPRYVPGTPLPDRRGSGWSPDTDRVPDASRITPPVTVRSAAHRLTLHAVIDAGVPLQEVASRYHPIAVRADAGTRYVVDLADGDVPMDHDLELTWRPEPSDFPRSGLFVETIDGREHYMLMVLQPKDGTAVPPVHRELWNISDTTCTRHGPFNE